MAWGGYGYGEDAQNGLIVGGCDAGHIFVYDPVKLLNKENGVIANLTAHSGAVRAIDFNSFKVNILIESHENLDCALPIIVYRRTFSLLEPRNRKSTFGI